MASFNLFIVRTILCLLMCNALTLHYKQSLFFPKSPPSEEGGRGFAASFRTSDFFTHSCFRRVDADFTGNPHFIFGEKITFLLFGVGHFKFQMRDALVWEQINNVRSGSAKTGTDKSSEIKPLGHSLVGCNQILHQYILHQSLIFS